MASESIETGIAVSGSAVGNSLFDGVLVRAPCNLQIDDHQCQ
jgi:hypothetical protein